MAGPQPTTPNTATNSVDSRYREALRVTNHPDAETWRAKSAEGDAIREAESNGTRVAPGGSYEVPGQMVRGTFVAENVSDCYWETRDSNGNIVDNNFVIAAPRVVAEIGDTAVVFTTQGGCGYWNRQ